MEERYIAALEISSSKIIGAIGIPRGEGRLSVVAVEQEKCQECVRRGFIQNVDETATRIGRILMRLQNKQNISPRQIKSVFIGLSGRSMKSIETTTSMSLMEEAVMSDEMVSQLSEQARHTPLEQSLEILDVVPRKYTVDGSETQTPVGAVGKHIKAHYDIVVARPELKKNIKRTLDKLEHVENAGYIVTAMATAHLILSEEEKRLGCLLVDIGAETTSVSIFKHGMLRYFAILPLGSRNITLDIVNLNLLEDRAEEIKISSGNALMTENPSSLNYNGVKLSEVNEIVSARSQEIAANIVAQIEYANLTNEDLPGGLVLIGGGSRLQGMDELLRKQSLLNVRKGELPPYITIEDHKVNSSEVTEVVSLLYTGAMFTDVNCLEQPRREQLPVNGERAEDEPEEATGRVRGGEGPRNPGGKKPSAFAVFAQRIRTSLSNMYKTDDDENDTELD